MTKVYLDDKQNFDDVFQQFYQQLDKQKAKRWYKKRYGYYEKPSRLKRKKRKMKRILSQRPHELKHFTLWLKVDFPALFTRTGQNAVGR